MADIHNPIVLQRADPYVIRFDGIYYFTGSYPSFDRIALRKADRLDDLQTAEETVIWRKHETGPMSHLIWAPELHRIDDKWYIYFGAAPNDGQSDDTFNHRIFCLENEAEDPTTGNWIERGKVDTGMDTFSLDATSFEFDGSQYLVWGQQDLRIDGHSNLYIARMANPWTLATEPVMLAKPEFDWECIRFKVCEGPAVIMHAGRIYITYSASGTGPEYAMGMLTASLDSNLLDASSWSKSPQPVFTTNAEAHMYGPGHNSFTKAEDGVADVMVYHVRNYTKIEGDPLNEPNRHACAKTISWSESGPVFGKPEAMTRWVPTGRDVLPPDGSH
ncbi:exo-alpha-L-arabinofuranosidase [Bifidobacterium actinocoloniiforme DSM 22766]|uniref:Exo-alpha-L-arabinofuranosidase n=1 Tax=Bifidobacterium actinocoloniiforme DSM 22766 TaxID=1437605 RepID=A0A086YZJ3_9BIFI|nr:family 43 glycosylhydrolase [Bifidobacterium actinocoloniiforme]AKV55016.1 alpha-N-arabinofuranosidase [Bifidobacterium actinocoloniiforme DSM 22766]KFI39693.1 exo-alpha-L-arabinofuranosidase [Bifidobacterium actinocoloniiforme DSM 22766]